eukprot:comp21227_c0_seq1/m.28884 comp21227_c0_seq1/g.28884  ORF comp21227_c0_seq1/g.28884 comp21227_c0_seq1/m.28884 type:complete len:321 (-) comp21227_c0_seq1:39-1001(-)
MTLLRALIRTVSHASTGRFYSLPRCTMATHVGFPAEWGKRVVAADPQGTLAKVKSLQTEGLGGLQVITDFDRTLTMYKVDGKPGLTSHGIVEDSGMLSAGFHDRLVSLKNKYYPIEIDPKIDLDTKYQKMEEWWDQAHQEFVRERLNKATIPDMVAKAHVVLRDGTQEMFATLHREGVPLLVFSAGLGDVIEEVLRQQGLMRYDNVHVVSNFMKFDDQGYVVGFQGRNIHVLNKSEAAIHDTPYAAEVEARHNVILLGDSLGDVQMSEGVMTDTVLKIGFLNDSCEEKLPQYSATFDLVVLDDGPMHVVNAILKPMISSQ